MFGNHAPLPLSLRVHAAERAGRIHKADDGAVELLRLLQRAHGLSISFRGRHAEVAAHALLQRMPLLLADDGDRIGLKPCHGGDDCLVVSHALIPAHLKYAVKEFLHIVPRLRTVLLARAHHARPGGLRLLRQDDGHSRCLLFHRRVPPSGALARCVLCSARMEARVSRRSFRSTMRSSSPCA
ncbi:hypothetical protein SDC9_167777 [bioreactor metagenome]|uniref:Uncharacterized protein n=1 Tax=bioreactor metagenome TaxID=1076179 RepID=A0A645G0N2_9ZZZZ